MSFGFGFGFPSLVATSGGPSLSLNFVGATTLDPQITFTRASAATYYNSSGLLTSAATNVSRFDYNPSTLAPQGQLVEEQRTNLITYSSEFDNAAWVKLGTATVSANNSLSPEGNFNADTLNFPASLDRINTAAIATLASTAYTFSVWLSGSGTVNLTLNTNGGTFKTTTTQITLTSTLTRYNLTITTNSDNTGLFPIIGRYDGSAGTGTATSCVAYGAQLEAGAFPTSFIPTTTAAATRAADVESINTLTPWFNATEGTLFVEASTFKTSGTAPTLTIQTAGGTSRHQTIIFTNVGATVDSSVTQANIGTNVSQSSKTAYAYKTNDFAISVNGGTVATDTLGTVPSSLSYMTIGKFDFGNGESLSGYIRRIAYYPRRLSNAELQGITT